MTIDVLRERILPLCERISKSGAGFMARCPAHTDGKASLSIAPGREHPVVFHCHANCPPEKVLAAFGFESWDDLCAPRDSTTRTSRAPDQPWMTCMRDQETGEAIPGHAVAVEYVYTDANGTVIRGVSRCVKKCFRQWRPDGAKRSGRRWTTKLDDGTEVGANLVYRLPELLHAKARDRTLFIVEGEKDADRLWSLGYPATTNPQGAGKWSAGHAAWFVGADVIVVADRDRPGQQHAQDIVSSLHDIARSIEVAQSAFGKDTSDHLDEEGPHVTEWLIDNGYHAVRPDGQPLTRLAVRHLLTVATPKADPPLEVIA